MFKKLIKHGCASGVYVRAVFILTRTSKVARLSFSDRIHNSGIISAMFIDVLAERECLRMMGLRVIGLL